MGGMDGNEAGSEARRGGGSVVDRWTVTSRRAGGAEHKGSAQMSTSGARHGGSSTS